MPVRAVERLRPGRLWRAGAHARKLRGMREVLITTTLLSIYAAARGSALAIGAVQTTYTKPTR